MKVSGYEDRNEKTEVEKKLPTTAFRLRAFLRLIRFPNLLIVVLTQYLIQYWLHIPYFEKAGLSPSLDHFRFALLVLDTVLIAAGGYIVNDLIDYDIDRINKAEQLIINKEITKKSAWRYYHVINVIGFIIALYIANHLHQIRLIFIFPLAVFLLSLYSKKLKQQVLTGNLVVALFCLFVPGVVIFSERATYAQMERYAPKSANELWIIVGGYLLFAFYSTMFREIVKDMEDMEGDRALGLKTLPIVWGINAAKRVAVFFGISLLAVLFPWLILSLKKIQYLQLSYIIIAVALPSLYALFLLYQAKTKTDFHYISQLIKGIMLMGLVYLLF